MGFAIEGKMFPPDQMPGARYHFVTPDYFTTIGVPLITGRALTGTDRDGALPVILVNQKLADTYFPGEEAAGRRITFSSKPAEKDWLTIAGVVGSVKDFPNSTDSVSAFYWPMAQQPPRDMILAIRIAGDPRRMIETVRSEVALLDRDLPVADVTTLDEIASAAVARQRFTLVLVGFFAFSALALSSVGIYGVLSYLVAQRTQEIGVRMALGAQLNDVLKLVIRQGMTLALGGVAVGLAASFALMRLMEGLLFEVSPFDPLTLGLVAGLLMVVAFVACWLPARRATKVDPIVTLRYE
jgi:putative ABC transport system permease protein